MANAELTSIIFRFLKCVALEGDDVQLDGSGPSELNKIWTGWFAQLAMIRKVFDGLGNLPLLCSLEIRGIPFLSPDVSNRLSEIFRGRPDLQRLALAPVSITHLQVDELAKPWLQELQRISEESPFLTCLEIPINLEQHVPILSDSFPSNHTLETLRLHATVGDFEDFTTQDKFKLGRYFERMFPNATGRCAARSGTPEWEFWSFINQLLSFSRASRVHAIREFEGSMSL